MTSILPIAIFLQEFAEECQLQPAEMEKEEIGAKAVLEPFVHVCVCVCVLEPSLCIVQISTMNLFSSLQNDVPRTHARTINCMA